MEFGSAHVYINSSSDEEEYIPAEELEQGIAARHGCTNKPPLRAHTGKIKPSFESQSDSIPECTSGSTSGCASDAIERQLSGMQLSQPPLSEMQLSQPQLEIQANSSDEDQPKPKPAASLSSEESTQSSEKEHCGLSSELCTPNPLPLPPKPPHGILKKEHKRSHKGHKVEWLSFLDSGGHKNILRKYQPSLVELISLPDLLPHLNHHDVITEEENKVLLDLTLVPKERVLKLISFISSKSGMVFAAFLEALGDEIDHPGHKELLSILNAAKEKESAEKEGRRHQGGVVTRQADTNIVAITFNTLVNAANVHAGDVVVCSNSNCTAVISHISKVTDADLSGKKGEWKCEFCGTSNFVELEPQEMPTKEETTYLLTPPPQRDQELPASFGSGGIGNTNLIFCIDVSGSMGVTVEVKGKRELKTDEKLRKLSISLQADISSQYMPQQRRDVTYVSRLQSVQSAIEEQMSKLVKTCPLQRVGVIAFSDEVTVLGSSKEVVVAGDRLCDVDELLRIGNELTPPVPISQCRDELSKKVSELEEGGQTALGPALLLSVLMAGSIPGSKVIVCTDGLANKGVGNLDVQDDEGAFTSAQQFYTDIGNIATDKGVTVSLVTIKGVECRVLELGKVADTTGGNVTLVDPLTVALEFSNIVANPIIATKVECKLVLHNRLCFQAEGFNGNIMHASVGNVTSETEFSFEYKARKPRSNGSEQKDALLDSPCSFDTPVMVGGVPHLPFQLQTEYTSKDGSKLLRVETKLKPVTQKRETAEKGIDFGVVGSHSVRTTAALASAGKIMEARANVISYGKTFARSSDLCDTQKRTKYSAVMSKITPLERQLRETLMRSSTISSVPHSSSKDAQGHQLGNVRSHSSHQPSPSQRLLAEAVSKSTSSRGSSFLSPSNMPLRPHMSDVSSPSVILTDDTEAAVIRRSSTDTVAADLYHCKKVSSKSIGEDTSTV